MAKEDDIFIGKPKQIVDKSRSGGVVWYVYDEYEFVGGYVEGRGGRKTYRPLTDYPTLFARFARLDVPDDEDGQARAALSWAREYGVLGLTPELSGTLKAGGRAIARATSNTGDGLEAYPQGSHSRDSVARFVVEARAAKDALKFYGAALKADMRTIATLDEYDEFYPPDVGLDTPEVVEARRWGLHATAALTQGRVSAWCSPMISWRGGSLAGVWGFKNLAGAMWLQMFFAVTGDHTGRLCANRDCPTPNFSWKRGEDFVNGGKARGRQRQYCSNECRMHAHYLRTTEPHPRA